MWKGREKSKKFEYLENEKSILDEIKNIIVFKGLAGGLLLKALNYFEVTLNIFGFSHVKEIVKYGWFM